MIGNNASDEQKTDSAKLFIKKCIDIYTSNGKLKPFKNNDFQELPVNILKQISDMNWDLVCNRDISEDKVIGEIIYKVCTIAELPGFIEFVRDSAELENLNIMDFYYNILNNY